MLGGLNRDCVSFGMILVVGDPSNLQAGQEEKETESGCGCAGRLGQESSYAISRSLSRSPGILYHHMSLMSDVHCSESILVVVKSLDYMNL